MCIKFSQKVNTIWVSLQKHFIIPVQEKKSHIQLIIDLKKQIQPLQFRPESTVKMPIATQFSKLRALLFIFNTLKWTHGML